MAIDNLPLFIHNSVDKPFLQKRPCWLFWLDIFAKVYFSSRIPGFQGYFNWRAYKLLYNGWTLSILLARFLASVIIGKLEAVADDSCFLCKKNLTKNTGSKTMTKQLVCFPQIYPSCV